MLFTYVFPLYKVIVLFLDWNFEVLFCANPLNFSLAALKRKKVRYYASGTFTHFEAIFISSVVTSGTSVNSIKI